MAEDYPTNGENLALAPGRSWQSVLERARELRRMAADACLRSSELKERFEELRSQPRSKPGRRHDVKASRR